MSLHQSEAQRAAVPLSSFVRHYCSRILTIHRSSQSSGCAASRRIVSLAQRAGGKHVEDIEVLLAFLIASCVLFASPLRAADPVKGNLVSVDWLEKNLKDADLLILDASPAQIYKEGTHSRRAQCRSVQLWRAGAFGSRDGAATAVGWGQSRKEDSDLRPGWLVHGHAALL